MYRVLGLIKGYTTNVVQGSHEWKLSAPDLLKPGTSALRDDCSIPDRHGQSNRLRGLAPTSMST